MLPTLKTPRQLREFIVFLRRQGAREFRLGTGELTVVFDGPAPEAEARDGSPGMWDRPGADDNDDLSPEERALAGHPLFQKEPDEN
jgi:hypothetical protein